MKLLSGAKVLAPLFLLMLTTACSLPSRDYSQADVDRLAAAITDLSPSVSPSEAARAAAISYAYGKQLAESYNVTDPALIHNNKVHSGQRDRGLCNEYTEDMLKRLKAEKFRTLTLHWATRPPTPIMIVHHSPVISAKGAPMEEGIVLDAWRDGGALFWAPVVEDTRYDWQPLAEVVDDLWAIEVRRRKPTAE
ncbi:hypothetical protein [Shimia biformata]|uniref:hypothetical protein n=1 Tax=Shimia biformata TaxID=1294299 RepID=UPI0019506906|nr:hypothetical protein [Shimia biformata]